MLVIGDIHLRISSQERNRKLCNSLLEIARSENIFCIILLGDILHSHSVIDLSLLTLASSLIVSLSKIHKTFVIIGNHDRRNNSDFLSEIHPFSGMENEELIIVNNVRGANVNGRNMLFVPYVFPGRFLEAIFTEITENDLHGIDLIFCHQEFFGAKMGAISSVVGDKWDKKLPVIISGHVHERQRLGDNILYIGTPIQHTYGESHNKSISLFDFKNNSSRKINDLLTEKRIKIDIDTMRTCRLTSSDLNSWKRPKGLIKLVLRLTQKESQTFSAETIKEIKEAYNIDKLIIEVIRDDKQKNKIIADKLFQQSFLEILIGSFPNKAIEREIIEEIAKEIND